MKKNKRQSLHPDQWKTIPLEEFRSLVKGDTRHMVDALKAAPDRFDQDMLKQGVATQNFEVLKLSIDLLDRDLLEMAAEGRAAHSILDLAADKLPQDILDRAVLRDPSYAMRKCAHLMSDEALNACAVFEPALALENGADRLSAARLDACAAAAPNAALQFASERLDPVRRDWCASRYPGEALKSCPDLLTKDRLLWCIKKHRALPPIALPHLDDETFDFLMQYMPDREHARMRQHMTEHQLRRCDNELADVLAAKSGIIRVLPEPHHSDKHRVMVKTIVAPRESRHDWDRQNVSEEDGEALPEAIAQSCAAALEIK